MAEETIPFVLIFIPLARSLGYDSITGAAIFNPTSANLSLAAMTIDPTVTTGTTTTVSWDAWITAFGKSPFTLSDQLVNQDPRVNANSNRVPESTITVDNQRPSPRDFIGVPVPFRLPNSGRFPVRNSVEFGGTERGTAITVTCTSPVPW